LEKNKGGRPTKLNPRLALKIFALARKGLTDKEIAEVFDLDEQTITNWKKSPQFFGSIKKAKRGADVLVERSLFERAIGYSHPEEKIMQYEGQVITHETTRQYPPDTVAAIFWLKNRKPREWRDKQEIEHSGGQKFEVEFIEGNHARKSDERPKEESSGMEPAGDKASS